MKSGGLGFWKAVRTFRIFTFFTQKSMKSSKKKNRGFRDARSFHSPNSVSSIHSTIFTIRHSSQRTHTISHRLIDNGSTSLRFGFATSKTPQVAPNIVSKYKERKAGRQLLLFGDAVDAEGGARSQANAPWEGDVLLNFDALVGLEEG